MTDQELIDLVQQKTPEELSLAELQELSERLRTSAALRDALLDRLHMEQYLGEALGRIELSVDRIISRAEQTPQGNRLGWLLGWGVASLLLIGASVLAYRTWRRDESEVAKADPQAIEQPDATIEKGDATAAANAEKPTDAAAANTTNPAAAEHQATGTDNPPDDRTPPEPFRLVVEAEKFSRGNLQIEQRTLGRGLDVIVVRRDPSSKDATPFAEYDIVVPATGSYQLELRYSGDPAPLRMSINGKLVKENASMQGTERRNRAQRWSLEGTFTFLAGKNVLRLETPPPDKPKSKPTFPYLDQIALKSSTTAADGRPLPNPWDEIAQATEPPPAFAEVCFDDIAPEQALRPGELRRWLAEASGQPFKVQENPNAPPVFDGLARLVAPWRDDLALRLAMYDHHGFKLHLWNGQEGVTLWYYAYPPTWAAYRTTRKAGEPKPERLALAATDNHLYSRLGTGAIELRHAEGSLVMSRGDIRLLTVPLAEPPQEVYLEGRAAIRGLVMARSEGLPEIREPRPTVLRADKPALLAWSSRLPAGAALTPHEDGTLELSAGKTASPAWAGIALQEPGLYEAIFEVDAADPGAGVYLGDAKGPRHLVNFFREGRTGWTSYAFLAPGDGRTQSNHDISQHPVPYALPRQWLRVVLGCGTLKCWTSADGVHWSRALVPIQNPNGFAACTHLGISCGSGDQPRRIKLRRLEVRQLSGLASLVPDELKDKAVSLAGDSNMDLGSWLATVIENQPRDVDSTAWRRACAVQTLAAGPSAALGLKLMSALAAEVIAEPLPLAQRLAFLEDLALIAPTWDGSLAQESTLLIARAYERLGHQLAAEGEPRPYTAIARALMTTPVLSDAQIPVIPESLVRLELLQLVEREEWEEAAKLCQRLEYWNRSHHPDRRFQTMREGLQTFVTWAEATSQRNLGRRGESILRSEWRHPLVESLSKEGYNILAEFNAALDGEQYKDACQIISSADPHGALGLLPDAKDPQLLMSLAGAVDLAMREHPPLRQAMNEHFGQRGRLRVRQAMSEGDVLALEAALMQFSGTEAAAEAYLWLGDRAFAAGDFARALGQYRAAKAGNLPSQPIEMRLRLAGAMLGREMGEPATQSLELGHLKLSAEEFEKLVAEMLKQYGERGGLAAIANESSAVPPPGEYEARPWSEISGDLGRDPQNVPYADLDWAGRQIAAAIADDTLLLSNRFHVAAYDLKSGERRWATAASGLQGAAHSWPLVPMRPAVAGDYIYVRRLTHKGPELVRIHRADGKVEPTRRIGDHVASDPLVVQDQLFVLTVAVAQEPLLQVSLTTIDPHTGDVVAQRPLAQLRDVWSRQIPCQAVAVEDRIVAAVGGGVVCCDLLGQVQWSRRQTWVPAAVDTDRQEQHLSPPWVREGRVYVTQPGVRVVQCLDLASGRLQWEQVVHDLRRMVELAGDKLVLETAGGFKALDAATGKQLWRHEVSGVLHGQLCGTPGGLLYACRERANAESWRPCLVWLDTDTGAPLGRSPLANLADKTPYLGPLVSDGTRLWAFSGRGREPKREILELVRRDSTSPRPAPPPLVAEWSSHLDSQLADAAGSVLTGWTLVTCEYDKKTRLIDEWHGERNVLVTLSSARKPVRLARELALPAGTRARLRMKVGLEGDSRFRIDVRVGGDSLLSQTIEPGKTENGWKELEVDLSRYAGGRHWLTVVQRDLGKQPGYAYWKGLEVVEGPVSKHN